MSLGCGKPRLSVKHFSYLAQLGRAIDHDEQPLVFDDGFVGFNRPIESEVIANAPQPHPRDRSESRSRQGRQAQARRRPPRETKSFRSHTVEATHGAGFRLLVQHYEALGFEDDNGLWTAIKAKPLGLGGPQAYFLIGLPNDRRISPRAWGFGAIGKKSFTFPLKHTNFPDASVCAFTKESEAWSPEDGLLCLVDHYALWAVKSWHRTAFGHWPGRQVGACALYRRREFTPHEWCGCDSGKRYIDCHQGSDLVVSEEYAAKEFQYLFRSHYSDRAYPSDVLRAASSGWSFMPSMADIFRIRRAQDEPLMTL